MSSYVADGYGEEKKRGGKRERFAGYLKAANELRQSYQQSYSDKWGGNNGVDDDPHGIPGSFPDVSIVSHGDEQMILFPSYARRHTKEKPFFENSNMNPKLDEPGDAEHWAREWQKYEDDKAIVDVDVRGWLYSPHRGPMTRKNRLLIGLARQLSGIPAPKSGSRDNSPDSNSLRTKQREHEERREEEKIAREAEQIMNKGRGEKEAALRGDYSERPMRGSDGDSIYGDRGRRRAGSSRESSPAPGHLLKRTSWNQPSEMTQADLLTANAHLMARLRPFLTNPMVSAAITVFFYDENNSSSRTIETNEAGHFIMRAALEFVPTHVRVLASEHLSAIEEVKITEPKGVSLITDVDDTIKHSSIGAGSREIFRNVFIRDFADLTIEGVKEWYNTMYDMGVGVHYVSNSPWQLFPVLVSFFRKAGLPPGSYHLKQYSGMLQGIFEPVAERKKGTLEKIMRDFPERKFILIGDSGEADLEVYTDVVLANPGKILGIFIRDVTTPADIGYFDSALGPLSGERRRYEPSSRKQSVDSRRSSTYSKSELSEKRPSSHRRVPSETKPQASSGPAMGTLIDFGVEPENEPLLQSHGLAVPRSMPDLKRPDLPRKRPSNDKAPPPRPSKPLSLQGKSTITLVPSEPSESTNRNLPPPPPKPRRSGAIHGSAHHPLKQSQSSADFSESSNDGYISNAHNKGAETYNHLPEMRSHIPAGMGETNPRLQPSFSPSYSLASTNGPPPLPRRKSTIPSSTSAASSLTLTNTNNSNSPESSEDEYYRPNNGGSGNKKLDLWRRRWRRAKGILDVQDVTLRAWRTGGDVCIEAVNMVEQAMREMGVEGYGNGRGKKGKGGGEVKVMDLKR
ncbi:hypothetical protein DSL72_007659 [Monilinia vaccinii-corymbosi]|uniref:Phosphatidate phosphatase APP1 catalytic domain-containing protein n=1 Tax=Monilinia vaccinii-corymbosi TaxID=61207 RepID=A0A8A3PII7_9HELO|nr:hypothetical protein DSL72_007659 [Monilinia vaccinii-corymbosi]